MGDRIGTEIRFHRNVAYVWTSTNLVLGPGEPGYESDTGKLKIGDGATRWNDLPYYQSSMGDSGSSAALSDHINSPTPHPIYDEGPSFALLYENAKV